MSTSAIVQKLLPASFDAQVNWNSAWLLPTCHAGVGKSAGADKYCTGPGRGQSRARSPAREYAGAREKPRLTLRDDLSACGHAQAGAQASN
ncbi:MAG: hypothetical protein ACYDB9_10105, partial [Gammaproteobacteria bacterium]